MDKIGRNNPCPCGSGKKFKKCCLNRSNKKVSPHELRMAEIGQYAVHLLNKPIQQELKKQFDVMSKDPIYIKKINDMSNKAKTIAWAQSINGASLSMDNQIRYFCDEYNQRNFRHGLNSMPTSLNVMEGFLNYCAPYSVFRVKKELDHLCSFTEFLEFVTSDKCDNDVKRIIDYTEEGIIYSYNIINDPNELTFSIDDGSEYGIGGVSLIRYGKEVSVIMLAGQKSDLKKETEKLNKIKFVYDKMPGRENLEPDKQFTLRAEPLFDSNDLWKVIVLIRIDLETLTMDVRYVLQDIGISFLILTDDISAFVNPSGQFLKPELKKTYNECIKTVNKYSAIFEICKTSLFLPLYFNRYAEMINEERHPTKLFEIKKTESEYKNLLINLAKEDDIEFRRISVLNRALEHSPEYTFYKSPDIRIQTSGFWRSLPIGSVGLDKYGRPIHGRTWVEKKLTWVENTDSNISIKVDKHIKKENVPKNKGFIYVMRSAAHEKDIFKIGSTKRIPEIRSNELSRTTGSPDKFLVVQEWEVTDCIKAEKMIHESLSKYRINPAREFFKAPYKEIRNIIEEILRVVNKS